MIFNGIRLQLQFHFVAQVKRADPCPGVCPNSAWRSRSKKQKTEFAKVRTTRFHGDPLVLLVLHRDICFYSTAQIIFRNSSQLQSHLQLQH